jgi:hypothetical protein
VPPTSKIVGHSRKNGNGRSSATVLQRSITEEIRAAAIERFGTLTTYAAHMGVRRTVVYQILSGHTCASVAMLEAMAAHAGVVLTVSSHPASIVRTKANHD